MSTSVARIFTAPRRRFWGRVLICVPIAAFAYFLVLIVAYSFVDPPISSLMAERRLSGVAIKQSWVPIETISRHVPTAVITAEDASYCKHWGVDWRSVRLAWRRIEKGRRPAGASTIPMQTVKNLFLWPGRSYFRKALEVPLSYIASLVWSKRRLMEIYLNIAEWGPGVFGIEEAARYHFRKSAARLNAREAALLAASLPNPHVFKAGRPGPRTYRVANLVAKRMRYAGRLISCVKVGK